MRNLTRITLNPNVMGGKPGIRGMRVTAGTIFGLVASGYSTEDILKAIRTWKQKTSAKRSPTLHGGLKKLNYIKIKLFKF